MHKVGPKLWVMLGEAESKCRHIAGAPLLPRIQTELLMISLSKGVLATTAIEGNTLTLEEVQARLQGDLELPPSKAYLGTEIDNVVKAVNAIGREVLKAGLSRLTPEAIKTYNRMVLDGLEVEEGVVPGECRQIRVTVGRYLAVDAEDCDYLLDQFCEWLNEDWLPLVGPLEEYPLAIGILKAIAAHLYLAWIHPFGDGNGRTARLIEFQLLLGAGLPQPAAHLLSNHYNTTRSEYYRQLHESSRQHQGDPLPFIEYALQGLVDSLKQQIDTIREYQLTVHWENYVHNQIPGDTAALRRKRHVALDLPRGLTPVEEIPTLSPRLRNDYRRVTDRTLQRDVEWLRSKGLILEKDGHVRPFPELMRAFLPKSAEPAIQQKPRKSPDPRPSR